MADPFVVDANVIVALLFEQDSLHEQAKSLRARGEAAGREAELLDFVVLEALSVIARRSLERKINPPSLPQALAQVEAWRHAGAIRPITALQPVYLEEILAVMAAGGGKLNANDAFLVVLQRLGEIDEVATFDENLAAFPGFKRFA